MNIKSIAILTGTLFFTPILFAATSTTTFTVSAEVSADCSVSANNLTFDTYDPTSSSNDDATTTIDLTCTATTPFNIGLNAGTGTGATVTTRILTNGASTLDYSLYRDASRTLVWGNTPSTDTMTSIGTGSEQEFTVYGRLPGSQAGAIPGTYSDTITVTVTY
ncbi:MAG: spore coat protein [Legionellales bacterium]|nr:spore coat protein [Legionellales bacterium]|tara:strand:+ start:328 stop:816 length:489 start_codon:yes stop_codon:yes gene_type:complete